MPDLRTKLSPTLVLFGLMLVAAGCSGQAPTAPQPAGPASRASLDATTPRASFPLLDGRFTLTSENGTISGTYTGRADGFDPSDAALKLDVTGGTGAFAGATGTLRGDGVGAFTGEGNFLLLLKGSVSTDASHVNLRVTLAGTSSISCVDEQIHVSQQGGGIAFGFGQMTASLSHDVGNTGCY